MVHPLLTDVPNQTKKQITWRESRPASARLFQGKLNPILQLQQRLSNQHVAQLVQAKRLTAEGKILGLPPKLAVGAGANDPGSPIHLQRKVDEESFARLGGRI